MNICSTFWPLQLFFPLAQKVLICANFWWFRSPRCTSHCVAFTSFFCRLFYTSSAYFAFHRQNQMNINDVNWNYMKKARTKTKITLLLSTLLRMLANYEAESMFLAWKCAFNVLMVPAFYIINWIESCVEWERKRIKAICDNANTRYNDEI